MSSNNPSNPVDSYNPKSSLYDFAEKKHVSIRRVVDFTSLTNPFGPSEKAKHALRKAVKEVCLPPDPQVRYLRRAIAKKENVSPERIIFGQGSSQLLSILIRTLGVKRVLIPAPAPIYYKRLVERQGAVLIAISLFGPSDATIGVDRLANTMTRGDMLLLPNPHGATGALLPAAMIEGIAHRLSGEGKHVVVDEALIEFARDASVIELTNACTNVIVLRSFSLFHSLRGLPLGYLVAPSAFVRPIEDALDGSPVSVLAAAAALASLRDEGFRKRTADSLKMEKEYLKGKLGGVRDLVITDTPCNFLLLRFQPPVADLAGRLLERNIIVDLFEDEKGEGFMRLPIRRRRENARFAKTLLRLIRQDGLEVQKSSG